MQNKMKGILTNICKTIKLIDLDDGLGQIENKIYIQNINNIINYCCSLFSKQDNLLYNLIRCDNIIYIQQFLNDIDEKNKTDIIQIFFNKKNEIPDKYICPNDIIIEDEESSNDNDDEESSNDNEDEESSNDNDDEESSNDNDDKESSNDNDDEESSNDNDDKESSNDNDDEESSNDNVNEESSNNNDDDSSNNNDDDSSNNNDDDSSNEINVDEKSSNEINGGAKEWIEKTKVDGKPYWINTITKEVTDNSPISKVNKDKDENNDKDEDKDQENDLLNPDKLMNDSIQDLNPSKLASDTIQNMIGMETDEEESKEVILKLFKEIFDDKIKQIVINESEIHTKVQQFISTLYTRAGDFTKQNLIDNIQFCLKPFIQPTYQYYINQKLLIHQEHYKNILDSIISEKDKFLMKILISSIKSYFIEINNLYTADKNLKKNIIKNLKNKFDIIF